MTRTRWTAKRRAALFLAHAGVCHICGGKINGEGWDVEHVIPLAMGGDDDEANCAPAHLKCHRAKTATDKGHIAKAARMQLRAMGIKRQPRNPIRGGKGDTIKRKINGTVERRE
jgi:5-methylcytosine-specific restriction protein A